MAHASRMEVCKNKMKAINKIKAKKRMEGWEPSSYCDKSIIQNLMYDYKKGGLHSIKIAKLKKLLIKSLEEEENSEYQRILNQL